MDPYLTCSFIFSFHILPPTAPHHGPPFWALSRAGRLSATHPLLDFRPPPNNSCPGRRLPPRLEPPYPGASVLCPAYRVVDHKSVLLVSFCQDVMQVGRAKPTCLSSTPYIKEQRENHIKQDTTCWSSLDEFVTCG
jgi:hypothetical protein